MPKPKPIQQPIQMKKFLKEFELIFLFAMAILFTLFIAISFGMYIGDIIFYLFFKH